MSALVKKTKYNDIIVYAIKKASSLGCLWASLQLCGLDPVAEKNIREKYPYPILNYFHKDVEVFLEIEVPPDEKNQNYIDNPWN